MSGPAALSNMAAALTYGQAGTRCLRTLCLCGKHPDKKESCWRGCGVRMWVCLFLWKRLFLRFLSCGHGFELEASSQAPVAVRSRTSSREHLPLLTVTINICSSWTRTEEPVFPSQQVSLVWTCPVNRRSGWTASCVTRTWLNSNIWHVRARTFPAVLLWSPDTDRWWTWRSTCQCEGATCRPCRLAPPQRNCCNYFIFIHGWTAKHGNHHLCILLEAGLFSNSAHDVTLPTSTSSIVSEVGPCLFQVFLLSLNWRPKFKLLTPEMFQGRVKTRKFLVKCNGVEFKVEMCIF